MCPSRLTLIALLMSAPGCSYLHYAAYNLVAEPVNCAQEHHFRARLRVQAHVLWREVARKGPNEFSRAYAQGFEDGFVEYVDGDGTGQPPAMPPARYRCQLLCNPAAQQKIIDWYDGFRHGAAEAIRLGIRNTVVVPIGLPPRRTGEQIEQMQPIQQQELGPPPKPIGGDKAPAPPVVPAPRPIGGDKAPAPPVVPAPELIGGDKAPAVPAPSSIDGEKTPSPPVGPPPLIFDSEASRLPAPSTEPAKTGLPPKSVEGAAIWQSSPSFEPTKTKLPSFSLLDGASWRTSDVSSTTYSAHGQQ